MTEIDFLVVCFRRADLAGFAEPQILRLHTENGTIEVWVGNEERCLRLVFDVSQGRIDEAETGEVVRGITAANSDGPMLGPADRCLIEAVLQNDRLAAIKQHKMVFGSTTFAARAEVDGWIAECNATGPEQVVEKLSRVLEAKNLEVVDPGGVRRRWAEALLLSEDGEL